MPKKVKMFQNERFVIIIKKTKTMVICRLILGIFGDFQNFQIPGNLKIAVLDIQKFKENENLKILSEKSNSVNKTKWKK